MTTRYDRLIDDLRAAAQPARPAPPELASYLEKVRGHAFGRPFSAALDLACVGRRTGV
jgi:hypothetical protein